MLVPMSIQRFVFPTGFLLIFTVSVYNIFSVETCQDSNVKTAMCHMYACIMQYVLLICSMLAFRIIFLLHMLTVLMIIACNLHLSITLSALYYYVPQKHDTVKPLSPLHHLHTCLIFTLTNTMITYTGHPVYLYSSLQKIQLERNENILS